MASGVQQHFSTAFPLERRDMVIDGAAERRLQAIHRDHDPPTAERAAHVVVEPIGGLGKPRPWGYSR